LNMNIKQNKSEQLWKFSEDMSYICILGALWLLCSLPIVTCGASTMAMYTVFMSHIIHGRKELVKPFFTAFKENFKNATILWLIVFPAMALFTVDAFYYLHLSGSIIFHRVIGIVMLCLLAIVIMVSCYAFPMMALYNNTVKGTLIKSIQYSYISWPWTLLTFAVNVAFPVLVVIGLWYFAFLFAGITGYANSHIMIRAIRRDIPSGRENKK
jgi:uncharacterized membrane protein YesL